MSAKRRHVAQIVELLERHKQRATYGAVGNLVNLPAQSVMRGEEKSPRNSFVVSKASGWPTGYSKAQCHELLGLNRNVISSGPELDRPSGSAGIWNGVGCWCGTPRAAT